MQSIHDDLVDVHSVFPFFSLGRLSGPEVGQLRPVTLPRIHHLPTFCYYVWTLFPMGLLQLDTTSRIYLLPYSFISQFLLSLAIGINRQ